MLQEFHFASPEVLIRLVNVYASSFYGSNLWDLYSPQVDKIYKSWNVTVRNIFNLPWKTHRYWIEIISNCLHPKTFLTSRFVKFARSLMSSRKNGVRFLASLCVDDHRTVMGKTLSKIADEMSTPVESLTPTSIKSSLKYVQCPADEVWRIPLLQELLDMKKNKGKIENMLMDDVDNMVNFLCTD